MEWDDRTWVVSGIKVIGGSQKEKLSIYYTGAIATRENKTIQTEDKRLDVENIGRLGLKMIRDGDDVDKDGKPYLNLPFLLVMHG